MSDNYQVVIDEPYTVFQPKGVACVSELDIVQLNNKQYTRKSYQSTMDLSKELQLETNVLSNEIPSDTRGGSSCSSSSIDDKERRNISGEQRSPPVKPPRKAYQRPTMPHSLVSDEIVVKPNPPQQQVVVVSPIEQPSIVEGGSRVSSFIPSPNLSKVRGHSRSKSETLKVNTFTPIIDKSKQDSSATEVRLDTLKETLLPSTPNLTPVRNRSPTPNNETLPLQPSRLLGAENSNDRHSKRDTKSLYCTLPRLVISEKGGITANMYGKCQMQEDIYPLPSTSENIDDDAKLSHVEEKESVSQASKMHFDSMLKEMNTLISPRVSPVTVDGEEEIALTDTLSHIQVSDSKPQEKGALSPETPFTLSKLSKSNVSKKIKSKFRERTSHRLEANTTKPSHQIRNSSFISHDEDGSILETKPLSNLTQLVAGEKSNIFKRDWPQEPVTHTNRMLSLSEQDDFLASDDTDEMSPTWHCDDDCQGCRSFQDPDKVDDADLPDQEVFLGHSSSQPQENLRLSNITESLHELKDSTLLEGFLHRTFFMREGKKLRKNWTNSYARYIMRSFNSGSTGIIHFSKSKDDDKKAEIFEFHTPCYMEQASDKKTSRQQVLVLRNDVNTEVLLQFEDREIAQKWIEVLKNHEGLEYNANPLPEKEERKGKKGSEKSKHETSMEQLSPDSKGIKDKLRNFIKRRPMKETLEHKGIYKESVFGSTLAELTSQDKTNIPIFVLYCIKHIEKSEENLRTDGLYRISGNAAQIQKIRYEVAQRKYTVLSQEKEIHNLSGALKLFFRELKEPLIPYDNYEDFIRATGSEFRRKNQQADKLMKAVNKLPVENYDTLKLLMQHLLEVSKYESENRMSLSNLAIVFGPCLMWPRETHSHDLMTDVMLHNRVVEGLLSDFDKIFTKR